MNKEITYFQRKRRPNQNYSLEQIFSDLRSRMPERYITKLKVSSYPSNGVWKRIYNMVEAMLNQSDVNHVTGDVNFLTILLNKNKTILTILDCGFMNTTNQVKRSLLKFFWLNLPVKRASIITVISEATKEQVLQYTNATHDKVRVIPVAISDRFKFQAKTFNENKPILLQIGTAPNKNILRLIDAITAIPCEFIIIGRLSSKILKKLESHQIDYTNYFGLTDEEVLEKYKLADLVTFVSTYEGFGMPILEANAVGRPVITSNVYSMPHVAGDAACIVSPNDVVMIRNGILKIINDKNYRTQLIINGRKNVERFSAKKIAEKYIEIYDEIAG